MKIGNLTLKISAPADLAAALEGINGCSPGETLAVLRAYPLASGVAQALMPFLKDGPSLVELADAIAAAGVDQVKGEVADLYEQKAKPEDENARKP